MKTYRIVQVLISGLVIGWALLVFAQEAQRPSTATDLYKAFAPWIRATLRFVTDLPLAPGESGYHVKVYDWVIAPQQDVAHFPLEGFATIEVRAGEVETIMEGATVERREGDYWIVPERARLGIKTKNDAAGLHGVVVIRK